METEKTSSSTDRTITQRARASTLSRRRRRLAWRILLLSLVTSVMTSVVILNRDTAQLREERKIGQRIASALEAESLERGGPPLMFPNDPSLVSQREQYYFNIFYTSQFAGFGRSGVCCLKEPVHFYLRSDGRIVVLFDGAHFDSVWMPENEFRKQAANLGFKYLMED